MKIVAFGDSITKGSRVEPEQCWLKHLEKKLGNAFELINAGVGGNSAREAMARYESDVLSLAPDAIFLEFGGNNNDPYDPARNVDDAEFTGHLETFKAKLPENCRVIVITFPPIINEWHAWTPRIPDGKLDQALDSQREIVRQFARGNNYPLLDLYALVYPHRYELLLKDGVHLNPDGQVFFAEEMYKLMKQEGWLNV
ncbi:MAG: hypothetical protein J6S58_03565 [Lentisphaeria bacterium]|nr:hypothetical protein [Lentisphaeria bacterium]